MNRLLEPEVMESLESVEAYNDLNRIWGNVLFEGFAESAARLGPAKGLALDVGCGPGWISIRLARLNPGLFIEAVDLSPEMLNLARENARRHGVEDRIRFTIGDAKRLPFEAATFDLVVCHNMLHQLPEPLKALKEIARVAKPEGGIAVRDVRRLEGRLMDAALPLYCRGYGPKLRELTYDSYRAGLTLREFTEIAAASGISGAKVRSYVISHIGLERPARAPRGRQSPSRHPGPIRDRLLRSAYVCPEPRREPGTAPDAPFDDASVLVAGIGLLASSAAAWLLHPAFTAATAAIGLGHLFYCWTKVCLIRKALNAIRGARR